MIDKKGEKLMGKKIDRACEWLVNIANDNSHGYSQDKTRRWGCPEVHPWWGSAS